MLFAIANAKQMSYLVLVLWISLAKTGYMKIVTDNINQMQCGKNTVGTKVEYNQ